MQVVLGGIIFTQREDNGLIFLPSISYICSDRVKVLHNLINANW